MDLYAKQALEEYNSETAHAGGEGGRLFWNVNATQFTFAPAFQFPFMPSCKQYRFTATDRNGDTHSFDADTPTASLAPIWGEIPTGFVSLSVHSIGKYSGEVRHLIGARTFFKCDPFPGREALPKRARSYREAALISYRYIYNSDILQYWLHSGLPKPDYAHNVYPAKMNSSVILAMVDYVSLSPENRESALQIARNAADYLISVSFPAGHPLEGLPPTYSFEGLEEAVVNEVAPAAKGCKDTTMMIYPVSAGIAYLALYRATGEEKYLDAALTIADFYKRTLRPEGSWYLLYDCRTGKPLKDNLCLEFRFVEFFDSLFELTQKTCWRELKETHYSYICSTCLTHYNWEGQFEDIPVTGNYRNLTHFAAGKMIGYIAENAAQDPEQIEVAKDLMRFIEDQFVVWGEFPYWSERPTREHHTPAGLEQYLCYVPIDSSTATIVRGFMDTYRLTKERLYLEKAMALADAITRHQDKDGMIPTFFIGERCEYGRFNYWINCQIHTTGILSELASLTEAEGIE